MVEGVQGLQIAIFSFNMAPETGSEEFSKRFCHGLDEIDIHMGHVTACDIDKLAFGMNKSRVDASHRPHVGIKIGQEVSAGVVVL